MRKIISSVLVCVLLVGSVFALASCGAVSGTYSYTILGEEVARLKFSGSNVSVLMEGEDGYEVVAEGTYEVVKDENDKQTVSFDFIDEGEGEEENVALKIIDFILGAKVSFEKGDGYIKIAGKKFEKV